MFRRNSKEAIVNEKELDKRVTIAQKKALAGLKNTIKLLILGAGGSGKTTLRKQFQRLYGNAYNDTKSRKEMREVIVSNIMDGLKAIVAASRDKRISEGFKNATTLTAVDNIVESLDKVVLTDAMVSHMRVLANDEEFKSILLKRGGQFQLQECFIPYFESLVKSYPEFGGPNWLPSADDCVRARIRSSGIIEIEFEIEKIKFKIYDAGGQRAERRKWIHAFDDVTALIFVTALTDYDEVLFEDFTQNRLVESLAVWEELANSVHFQKVPILLFFNKLDLFQDKYMVRRIPLNISEKFPDAPHEFDVNVAVDWYSRLFLSKKTKGDSDAVYIHTTTAIDSQQIDDVFKDVKEILLLKTMAMQGMIS